MRASLFAGHHLTENEYLTLERISPFKHEFVDGVMYAMHVENARDYLEMESESPFRHEYMDGVMYAMAGGKKAHHLIERNLSTILHLGLRGKRCSSSSANEKLKLPCEIDNEAEFCYPDGMISCDPTDGGETNGHSWIERPSAIFEILSKSTRDVDEGQKRDAYLALPSLQYYVRIEQDRAEIVIERRAGSLWMQELVLGLGQTVHLPAVGLEFAGSDLYEDVKFPS